MTHYLVTGAAGFIGSNIVKQLNERGITEIIAVDDFTNGDKHANLADCQVADFLTVEEFSEICAREKQLDNIKAVLHNGACADTMENNGKYMMERNFTYSKNVFHWCRKFTTPFIYASSASVYGINKICRESIDYEKPINMYAYSKLVFDQFIRKNIDKCSNTVVGLRYFNVYGPREKSKGKMASMVFQLAQQLKTTGITKLFSGTDGYGDGGQLRDFICARDVAKVNLFFADHAQPIHGIFNVGTGKPQSFNTVAELLIKKFGKGKIEYIPFPPNLQGKYQSYTAADLTSFISSGYKEEFFDLSAGIEYCWENWMK